MPNQADVVHPTPSTVPAGAAILGIKVSASGTDTVDPASSDVGTVSGGVYSSQAGLTPGAKADIYVPDAAVLAPVGKFKIRANVQFASGGMPTENLPASHAGDFQGQALKKRKPKPKPVRKRAAMKPAKGAAKRGAKKSRPSAAKPAAKKTKRPAPKGGKKKPK
jgi:hypothetical protein